MVLQQGQHLGQQVAAVAEEQLCLLGSWGAGEGPRHETWHWMAGPLGTAKVCPPPGSGRLCEGLQGPAVVPPCQREIPVDLAPSDCLLRELETLKNSVGPCLEGQDLHRGGCPVVGPWMMEQLSARTARAAALPCPGLHREETGANPMKWDEINKAAELF